MSAAGVAARRRCVSGPRTLRSRAFGLGTARAAAHKQQHASAHQLVHIYVTSWVRMMAVGQSDDGDGGRRGSYDVLVCQCAHSSTAGIARSGRPLRERRLPEQPPSSAHHVAVYVGGLRSAAASAQSVQLVLALAQQLARQPGAVQVLLITHGTSCAGVGGAAAASDAAPRGTWGVARVLRLEHAALGVVSAEVARGQRSVGRLMGELRAERTARRRDTEREVAWSAAGERHVARLRRSAWSSHRPGL